MKISYLKAYVMEKINQSPPKTYNWYYLKLLYIIILRLIIFRFDIIALIGQVKNINMYYTSNMNLTRSNLYQEKCN